MRKIGKSDVGIVLFFACCFALYVYTGVRRTREAHEAREAREALERMPIADPEALQGPVTDDSATYELGYGDAYICGYADGSVGSAFGTSLPSTEALSRCSAAYARGFREGYRDGFEGGASDRTFAAPADANSAAHSLAAPAGASDRTTNEKNQQQ